MCDIVLEELLHFLPVLLQCREFGQVVFGHHTVHLGLAELNDTLAQIAEVLEQIVVVGINKFP
jgi:hypothetical protein